MRAPCLCGCGDTPGSETAQFLPGHDARYKSALVKRALGGDAEAEALLAERNWTKFLDKARSAPARSTNGHRARPADGLPINAQRITPDMGIETIADLIERRHIVIRYNLRGIDIEEKVMVGRVKAVIDGDIDFWVLEHTKKGEPILNGCRTVRADTIVGVLNT